MNPAFIEQFIRDPHGMKPMTTMPDALARPSPAEKERTATEMTHFLLSLKSPTFAPQAPDHVAAMTGHRLFHSRGCAACHAPHDEQAMDLPVVNSVPLGPLEKKHSQTSLVKFLREPHASLPAGRMPDMRLVGYFNGSVPKTKTEAKLMVFDYIESFYNRRRRNSATNYLSPSS